MAIDEYGNRRFYGVYRGVVEDVDDPLKKGRVRLRVPQVFADTITDWSWPKTPQGVRLEATAGQGTWVEFEGGDPSFPVWGGVFGQDDTYLGPESVQLKVEDLADVDTAELADGNILMYQAASSTWVSGDWLGGNLDGGKPNSNYGGGRVISGGKP